MIDPDRDIWMKEDEVLRVETMNSAEMARVLIGAPVK